MRKYFLALALTLISLNVINAQERFKPVLGSISVEVGFAPFAADGNSIIASQNSAYAIYTASEDLTLRLGLGFASTTATSDDKSADWTKATISNSGFFLKPGILYTYDGTERLTPYIGAELTFGTTSNEKKVEYYDGLSISTMKLTNEDDAINTWSIGAVAGFNYYFAQNLYIGAEVGVGYFSTSLKNKELSITGQPTEKSKEENKLSTLRMYAVPTLRLGWAF